MRLFAIAALAGLAVVSDASAQQKMRVALAKQTFSPNGQSAGPNTMANGGIQQQLTALGIELKVQQAMLTAVEDSEYGGWKRLGLALGHYSDIVAQNEREGWFTVGLYATCPSMPGMVSGLQRSGRPGQTLRVGMLWLDAHPDFNTPETTRSLPSDACYRLWASTLMVSAIESASRMSVRMP